MHVASFGLLLVKPGRNSESGEGLFIVFCEAEHGAYLHK